MMTIEDFLSEWRSNEPFVRVHTSGSTGTPKSLLVSKERMRASARLTCRYLNLHSGDTALLCMPLDFIAGKMMVVRSDECRLRLFATKPSAHPFADEAEKVFIALSPDDDIDAGGRSIPDFFDLAAMTPMQVFSTVGTETERERLMKCRHLIIGGGSIGEELEQVLLSFPNNVWSSYGMTETLSHIALRRVNGSQRSEWYEPFEGVTVGLTDEGCLWIDCKPIATERIVTNDIAEIHLDGRRFKILGRKDNVICSGGIKIQAEEVERMIASRMRVHYIITKCRDQKYGEIVVLLYEKGDQTEDEIRAICSEVLPKYYRPKRLKQIDAVPMTATDKPNRAAAEQLAERLFASETT